MRVLAVLAVAILLLACGEKSQKSSIKKKDANKQPVAWMKFENTSSDFGEIKEGEKVVLFFTFENFGSGDLIIYEAIPSCGCASPKFDSAPVKPGEKRNVEVTFDSEGWSGQQQKSITFKTNGVPEYSTITIAGQVN